MKKELTLLIEAIVFTQMTQNFRFRLNLYQLSSATFGKKHAWCVRVCEFGCVSVSVCGYAI